MSWEAEQWARQQRTGDPVTKAVLVGIANWMNPRGDECLVSIRRIADEVEVSTRTVQRHMDRLEQMGLLEKLRQDRADGGQGWNSFRFPTYRPTKVSHVAPTGKRDKPHDKLTPPHDNMTGGGGDNLSPGEGDKMTSPPMTQLCHGGGDNGVTPERGKGIDKSPPTPPLGDGDDGKRIRGERIPADWAPPPIGELPPAAKAKVQQWPSGAYEAEAEAFRDFWLSEDRAGARKRDWNRTWYNRINECTGRVMRDAKAGVTWKAPPSTPAAMPPPVDTSREGEAARKIRASLRDALGQSVYDQWFAPARFRVDGGTLSVIAASSFAADYLRNNFVNDAGRAMHDVLGPDAELHFRTERPAR